MAPVINKAVSRFVGLFLLVSYVLSLSNANDTVSEFEDESGSTVIGDGVENENKTEISTDDQKGWDLKDTMTAIMFGIVAILTAVVLYCGCLINKKSKSNYARGENLPNPVVDLSADF